MTRSAPSLPALLLLTFLGIALTGCSSVGSWYETHQAKQAMKRGDFAPMRQLRLRQEMESRLAEIETLGATWEGLEASGKFLEQFNQKNKSDDELGLQDAVRSLRSEQLAVLDSELRAEDSVVAVQQKRAQKFKLLRRKLDESHPVYTTWQRAEGVVREERRAWFRARDQAIQQRQLDGTNRFMAGIATALGVGVAANLQGGANGDDCRTCGGDGRLRDGDNCSFCGGYYSAGGQCTRCGMYSMPQSTSVTCRVCDGTGKRQ